eukprot:19717-Rhodomonas_salina.3
MAPDGARPPPLDGLIEALPCDAIFVKSMTFPPRVDEFWETGEKTGCPDGDWNDIFDIPILCLCNWRVTGWVGSCLGRGGGLRGRSQRAPKELPLQGTLAALEGVCDSESSTQQMLPNAGPIPHLPPSIPL